MSKAIVNMTPNPSDIQTIHCSQGDTEAREWEFELHNNGEVIDAGGITEQMVFKSYKGGTEQLLPVNTDDPSTSPIIADIQYPDEEKTEQEFTYRESPTTIDGKALIEKIKGNTLVWNQLISPNPSATGTSAGITYTFDGNGKITLSGTASGTATINSTPTYPTYIVGHKYFLRGCPSGGSTSTYALRYNANGFGETGNGIILTATASSQASGEIKVGTNFPLVAISNGYAISGSLVFTPQVFDLTVMGLDTKTLDEVKQWFADYYPLPFYSYDTGSLLSFNGTGIKSVGFNQWDEEWEIGSISSATGQNQNLGTNRIRSKNYIPCLPNTEYCLYNGSDVNTFIYFYDGGQNFLEMSSAITTSAMTFTTPQNCCYLRFRTNDNTDAQYHNNICLNISDASKNGTYEPYQTYTLEIPTSTYFPTGMKSAGSVYDELSNNKAVTRIGEVDLGTLDWYFDSDNARFTARIVGKKNGWNNIVCANYSLPPTSQSADFGDKMIKGFSANDNIAIKDSTYGSNTSALTTALSGVMLYYELATEQVTEFTHASLICEDGESALYQDVDSLVCDCTEDFSKDSGFKDCKIKFSKGDGVVYSNKIQLHIERKP